MGKKLGQHFLKDAKKLKKIAEALEITPRDIVIEIGPGHGELTNFLLKANPKKIIAIEKDARLVEFLNQKFQALNSELQIVRGDALKVFTSGWNLESGNWKLAGNIPYYITGHLLRKISELEKKPKLVVLTIQKEVAERIAAQPPHTNLLAASVQFWGKPKIVGYISKKSFRPQPKVDSAIIKIISSPQFSHGGIKGIKVGKTVRAEEYYKFIKILFRQPRKTVMNNLREGLKLPQKEIEKRLQELNISPDLRPANLSMSDINKLSAIFSDKRV